ncbi:MAG: peptidase M61, partial [Thermoplasmata archaeon]|nr:peptidase M61 [Thermoplasmata archaeon]
MTYRWGLVVAAWCLAGGAHADRTAGPQPTAPAGAIAAPEDVDFPGVVEVSVDATDTDHRIFRIHETLPVPPAGDLVLLYPKWLPGTHAPEGPLDRLAGLVVRVAGTQIQWVRDAVEVYAFHVAVPPGTRTIDVDFQYLSPVSHAVGRTEVTPDLLVLDWNAVVLYPAGYFARRIPLDVRLTLPDGWGLGTALETASAAGPMTCFRRVSLETLVDSPVRAGR